jgi:hypothetical protein
MLTAEEEEEDTDVDGAGEEDIEEEDVHRNPNRLPENQD